MLLTLCTKMTLGCSLDESIALATRYGYHGLEIFGVPEHLPPKVAIEEVVRWADILRDAGIAVWCLATYTGPYGDADASVLARLLEEVRRYCQIADLLGCDYIRQIAAYGSPSSISEEVWRRTADGLRRAADVAAEYGKHIVLETHDNQIVETVESTLRLIELIDRHNVGITFDPANHVRWQQDWGIEAIHQCGEVICNVHVKDVTLQGEHRLFGEGDMYYSAVWQGLAEIGYDGALGLECHVKPCDELPVEKIVEHEIRQVRASLATSPLGGRLAEQSD